MAENDDYTDLLNLCEGIPLHALRMSSRRCLANYLDIEGSLYGDYVNDWTGLAELACYRYNDIKNFQTKRSPTEELLHAWGNRPDLNPTCDNLVRYLLQLDRRDVLTDCHRFIGKLHNN